MKLSDTIIKNINSYKAMLKSRDHLPEGGSTDSLVGDHRTLDHKVAGSILTRGAVLCQPKVWASKIRHAKRRNNAT